MRKLAMETFTLELSNCTVMARSLTHGVLQRCVIHDVQYSASKAKPPTVLLFVLRPMSFPA
jgi:hypothetical protein